MASSGRAGSVTFPILLTERFLELLELIDKNPYIDDARSMDDCAAGALNEIVKSY